MIAPSEYMLLWIFKEHHEKVQTAYFISKIVLTFFCRIRITKPLKIWSISPSEGNITLQKLAQYHELLFKDASEKIDGFGTKILPSQSSTR